MNALDPYFLQLPTKGKVPIVISSPHSGTEFPDEIAAQYNQELIKSPDDTDWFLDQLYQFAPDMGITFITARYSRWVIDLNRTPNSEPLYNDGRIITELCPSTTFTGENIYLNQKPDQAEIQRRLDKYYWPYYQKIQSLLDDLKAEFGHVLLYDAHSIRQEVKTIYPEKFPDLILGTADEKSAHPQVIETAVDILGNDQYSFSHNYPFKGGHITRYFGKPSENQHAIQLERCKTIYMNDSETEYAIDRSEKLQAVLKTLFSQLSQTLQNL